jgi:hypothetical protein
VNTVVSSRSTRRAQMLHALSAGREDGAHAVGRADRALDVRVPGTNRDLQLGERGSAGPRSAWIGAERAFIARCCSDTAVRRVKR